MIHARCKMHPPGDSIDASIDALPLMLSIMLTIRGQRDRSPQMADKN
jgi:hypothetical protein